MSGKDFLFDQRIVQRHIQKGLISASDVDTRLKKLEDVEDNMTLCLQEEEEEQQEEGSEDASEEGAEAEGSAEDHVDAD